MVPVNLVRTYQQNIENDPALKDGYLYIAKDTGRVYVDFSDSRVELCAIHAGPGIRQDGNLFTANVTDVVNESGQSVLDNSGVAHVSGAKLAYEVLTIPSGEYSATIRSSQSPERMLPISVVSTKIHETNEGYQYINTLVDWNIKEESSLQNNEWLYVTTFTASITRPIDEDIRVVFWYQPYQ